MILFLDDCVYRTKIFVEKYPKAFTTSNSKSMIQMLMQFEAIRYLFLDHDLFYDTPDTTKVGKVVENTGMEVVEWLEKNSSKKIYQIIIHTMNGYAAPVMTSRLQRVGFNTIMCPFSDLIPQLGR